MIAGIQVSSLKPLLTSEEQVETAFGRIAAMGCKIVQLQWIDKRVSVGFIAESLRKKGLQSVSVQDFYEMVHENSSYYIQLNRLTGGTWVCVSRIPERLKSAAGLKSFIKELRLLQEQLHVVGQKLCFHPVSADYQEIEGLRPVEWLMEQMPDLQLALDLYHLNKCGYDMPAWIRKYVRRICMVHYKDAVGETLVPAGAGDTNWSGVTRACLETKVPYAFVEQERWNRDPYVCLKEAMDWLEKDIATCTEM